MDSIQNSICKNLINWVLVICPCPAAKRIRESRIYFSDSRLIAVGKLCYTPGLTQDPIRRSLYWIYIIYGHTNAALESIPNLVAHRTMGSLDNSADFSWAVHLVLAGLTLVVSWLLASLRWSQLDYWPTSMYFIFQPDFLDIVSWQL